MSQSIETNKHGWPLPEKLCPRCYFAEAKIEGDIGVCQRCGPIRKVHYELKSIRQGKLLTGDYWRLAAKRTPKPTSKDPRLCVRCGKEKELERDHIKPRAEGGQDEDENLRDFCIGCHDWRHSRDSILKNIEKFTNGNQAQLTMWIFRLGVLEMLNTPELVRQRGYVGYWTLPETHYSRWFENIKVARKGADVLQEMLAQQGDQKKLP